MEESQNSSRQHQFNNIEKKRNATRKLNYIEIYNTTESKSKSEWNKIVDGRFEFGNSSYHPCNENVVVNDLTNTNRTSINFASEKHEFKTFAVTRCCFGF